MLPVFVESDFGLVQSHSALTLLPNHPVNHSPACPTKYNIDTIARASHGYIAGVIISMVSTVLPPRDVTSTVKYLLPGSKNERYFSRGIEVNIGDYEDVSVVVHDARPYRDDCTLETSGFILVDHNSKVRDSKVSLI